MEFSGIGTVPLEPPPKELRSFMRRKYITWIRSFDVLKNGVIKRRDLLKEARDVAEHVQKKSMLPAEEREHAEAERMKIWDFLLMCDKKGESITEGELADAWMDRIYLDAESRKPVMEKHKAIAKAYFEHLDLNLDRQLTYEEWMKGTTIFDKEQAKALFEQIDARNDGAIDIDEFLFGFLTFHYCSGPDSLFSLWFGPILEENQC